MMTLNGTQHKTSTVLQAMLTGLQKSKDDPNFRVKMTTFGHVKDQLCYGCCATVTLAEMFGEGQLASEMMLRYVNTGLDDSDEDSDDDYTCPADVYLSDFIKIEFLRTKDSLPISLLEFEIAIDSARTGDVSVLIAVLTGEVNKSFDDLWFLDDKDWEQKVHLVEATIVEMIAAGY